MAQKEWQQIATSCIKASNHATANHDDESAAHWAQLAATAASAAGGMTIEANQFQCSVEITQGAKDKGPRFGGLKIYFAPWTEPSRVASYIIDMLGDIKDALERGGASENMGGD